MSSGLITESRISTESSSKLSETNPCSSHDPCIYMNNKNKNILMICYYYPPLMDTASKRSVAFAQNLKKCGWQPYVLTVKNPDKSYCILGTEPSPIGIHTEKTFSIFNPFILFGKMGGLLKRALRIVRIELKRNPFYDFLCIPDIFIGWIPLTILKGFMTIKKHGIRCIYVSCTPFSSGLIGVFLKILTKKPLLVDFRDPYALEISSVGNFESKPNLRMAIDRKLERFILKHADVLLIVTDELRDAYIKSYPEYKSKIFTIHNGFDEQMLLRVNKASKFNRFTIVYSGNYYYIEKSYSNAFFEALSLLKETGKINRETFQFFYYGSYADCIGQLAQKYGVDDFTKTHSQIPYHEMLQVISQSHILYVRALEGAFPTKISDGLALNVPLLADVPPGEAEEIIARFSPGSYIITEKSREKISISIANAIEQYRKGSIPSNDVVGFLEEFSRRSLSLKLISIIEKT